VKIELTENQKQAIESTDKSMLVVAGAGSGKTLCAVKSSNDKVCLSCIHQAVCRIKKFPKH